MADRDRQSSKQSPLDRLPLAEQDYLRTLTAILHNTFHDDLVGVYVFGSASTDAYQPGISDLDVQAVISSPSPIPVYHSLATSLSHSTFHCPATKLEFVVYASADVGNSKQWPRYQLNFNTGKECEADAVSTDLKDEDRHWFLLDIATGRTRGGALFGPPPTKVFAEPSRHLILDALDQCLVWHIEHESTSVNTVLNTSRAWRFLDEGDWGSKDEGANWVLSSFPEWDVVREAVDKRRSGERDGLMKTSVGPFVQDVLERLKLQGDAI